MVVELFKKNKQFIKFAIVGASNTLITLIAYNILIKFGVNYILANIIGYFVGMLNGFVWSKNWVFDATEAASKLFFKFVLVNLLSLGFSTLALSFLVSSLTINKTIAQLITTVGTVLINYVLNKIWTFKK
ncbi:GtrA family protein [Clostridium sp. 19966]|uniref:GtrA family protein n=1 Tax=Clostridium sp. 19966 TaxID=2768166 RepID=UPI0028DF78EE|nr:GtrA family protein [Clostridium sp. 19966]MDT8715684.1 GtrA family protein [Clostridium sp. 19966]